MRGPAPLLLAALIAAAAPAQAHHSLTGYDPSRRTALTGEVAEFHFIQPHPFLTIEVQAGGARQLWRLEMDNLWELRDIGLTKDSFKRGERVTVSGDPMRDGSMGMYLRRLDRPGDGLRYEQAGFNPTLSNGKR